MKNILIILALSISLISCNKTAKAASENEKLIRQYFDLFNKHQWKEMSDMYIENAEFKDPTFGIGVRRQSKQEIIEKYAGLGAYFPNIQDKILQIYPSGEKNIIVEFISTGTGIDKSKFTLQICTIFTIENGKITQDFTYYDNFEKTAE
ncbi:nuclear transport factor 2 family protein [Flavobacterium ginsenosidimutans]|uniref:nuclear transport factor 2 family protein n=1 Tax=Flavobacterium ginsenosidimutans TaxID=687844 RepID=UPI003D97A0FD